MEQNGIWSEDLKIRAFMVDRHQEANLVAIQNIFQEVAGNHANFRRLGFEDMQAKGMAWVLNRLKINIFKFPKWTETVTVKTWVSQMQPFSHRHFQMILPDSEADIVTPERDEAEVTKGVILANAYSIWIPIDVVTKRPKRITNHDLTLNTISYDCEMPEKLTFANSEFDKSILSSERQVYYSDLDMLGHVNNAKYVEWLIDDFFKENRSKKPKILEINYLGEVFEGSTVQFFIQKQDDMIFYSLVNKEDGKEVVRAKLDNQ